jgi:hypothetical protein
MQKKKKRGKMTAKASKAKGRRLQNYVRDKLREVFIKDWKKLPSLEEDDIKSQTMGMTGEDIVMSPAAKRLIPYSFECKNVEKLNVWNALEQAESNCEGRTPVLVFKRNRSKVYVAIEFDSWLDTIK